MDGKLVSQVELVSKSKKFRVFASREKVTLQSEAGEELICYTVAELAEVRELLYEIQYWWEHSKDGD